LLCQPNELICLLLCGGYYFFTLFKAIKAYT
jgi:hypothetical protein